MREVREQTERKSDVTELIVNLAWGSMEDCVDATISTEESSGTPGCLFLARFLDMSLQLHSIHSASKAKVSRNMVAIVNNTNGRCW